MRQFVSWRWWLTILALVGTTVVLVAVVGRPGGGATEESSTPETRRADLIGVPDRFVAGDGWRVHRGVTRGAAEFELDGRSYRVAPGTLADVECDPTSATCLLLVDRLGDAVVWMASLAIDAESGEVRLPPIETPLDGVTWARLANGWELPLLTVVERRCPVETASFLDFLDRFGENHVPSLDPDRREISAVTCVLD